MTRQFTRDSFLYHVSPIENLAAISRQGVQPQSSHRDSLEADLPDAAADAGIEFPIDRQECVFFYPTLPEATKLMRFFRNSEPEWSHLKGIAVIDATQIDAELYAGDFKLISDAIDLQHLDEPDDAIHSDSYEDALYRYVTSLKRLDSFEELSDLHEEFHTAEVVIEGGVHPETIVEWLFLKNILTE